jgi:hypothetical protein
MKLLSWDVGIYNLSYCILDENKKIIDWNIINLVDENVNKKNKAGLFENIPVKLNTIPLLLDVDIVIIENQPSLKNPQMKSIQMIIYSYFLIYGKVIHKKINKIDFCSAGNKLKIYDGPSIVLAIKKSRKKGIENTDPISIVNEIEEDKSLSNDNKKIAMEETIVILENKKGVVDSKKKPKIKYSDKKKLAIEHTKYFLDKDAHLYEKDENPLFFKDFFMNHKKKDDLADSYLQGLYYLKNYKE